MGCDEGLDGCRLDRRDYVSIWSLGKYSGCILLCKEIKKAFERERGEFI